MGFENFGSRAYEQQEVIDKAAEKAEQVVASEAIDPRDFEDLYGSEAVASDLAYVERREAAFERDAGDQERESKKAATIIEATLGDGIGLHDWMGASAYFIMPSRYDDIKNGIDGLVEFEEEPGKASHLGLALDATYRNDVASKLHRINEKIATNDPMQMKYFASEALDLRGELRSVPRAVASFDYATVARLGELWLTKDKKALAADPVQFQILEQLRAQCELFEKVAGNAGRSNLKGRYEHGRELINQIYKQRRQEVEDTGDRDLNSYRLLSTIDALKRD